MVLLLTLPHTYVFRSLFLRHPLLVFSHLSCDASLRFQLRGSLLRTSRLFMFRAEVLPSLFYSA